MTEIPGSAMNDRINAYLEGELAFEALDEREQAEARVLEAAIRAAAGRFAGIRAPDLKARVMAALPAESAPAAAKLDTPPPSAHRRLVAWLGSFVPTHGLAPRPALAMAALSLAVGFGLGLLVPTGSAPAPEAAVAETPMPTVFVRFELDAAGAADVRLAGSFTGWEPRYELAPLGDGRWSITLPLAPGVHDYVFVVDGDHIQADPYAPRVADGFGGYNSRLALLTPEV